MVPLMIRAHLIADNKLLLRISIQHAPNVGDEIRLDIPIDNSFYKVTRLI